MQTLDLLQMSARALRINMARSLLTMLGIIIGVCGVVLMSGIGKSMEGVILGQISFLGPETVAVWPGQQGPEGGAASLRPDFDALTLDDADALRELQTVDNVAPIIFVPGSARYGREEMSPRIVGSNPSYFVNQQVKVAEGRLHDELDEASSAYVAIIGSDVEKDLFFNQSALGKKIDLSGRKFTVIGILEPIGTQFLQNIDDRIVIPLQTAIALTGRNYADMITLRAANGTPLSLAVLDVESLLRLRHRILPLPTNDNDDFLVRNAEQAQDILLSVSLGLTFFITIVASIALIVGGIGIMNIMLVAVTERTREIGLRKAIGATRNNILQQFLVESVFLTLCGGLIGVCIGIFLMYMTALIVGRFLDDYVFAISSISILASLGMAMLTGLVFGIYPARKAAQLHPISALRYE